MSKSSVSALGQKPSEQFFKQGADAELRGFYYSLAEMIIQGDYEPVAEVLRSLRQNSGKTDSAQEVIRRLLAIRLAMRRGDPTETTDWLDLETPAQSWLHAEKLFVSGYIAYQNKQPEEMIRRFAAAANEFKTLGMLDRSFLAAFNSFIGYLERENPISLQEQMNRLRGLESMMHPFRDDPACGRILALVYRQRAHAFEDDRRLHAALEEVTRAIAIFQLHGSQKDYHMGLLHAADLALDLGDVNRARCFNEYVIGPVDSQVEFPLAYIGWRLGGALPHYGAFTFVPLNWKEKFERLRNQENKGDSTETASGWIWNLEENILSSADNQVPIRLKPSGMEARLLKILMKEKVTKSYLIEIFWPEKSEIGYLDNRLHRLISRLNQKADLVQFDGKRYGLKNSIRFATSLS